MVLAVIIVVLVVLFLIMMAGSDKKNRPQKISLEFSKQDHDIFEFEVAGVHISDRFSNANSLFHQNMKRVSLYKDVHNKYDVKAIEVLNDYSQTIGYVPKEYLNFVHSIYDRIVHCQMRDCTINGTYMDVIVVIIFKKEK